MSADYGVITALIGSVAVSPAAALIVAEEAAVAEDLVEVEGVRAVVMAVVVVVVAMAMENLVLLSKAAADSSSSRLRCAAACRRMRL